jgi:hypothetical protein
MTELVHQSGMSHRHWSPPTTVLEHNKYVQGGN